MKRKDKNLQSCTLKEFRGGGRSKTLAIAAIIGCIPLGIQPTLAKEPIINTASITVTEDNNSELLLSSSLSNPTQNNSIITLQTPQANETIVYQYSASPASNDTEALLATNNRIEISSGEKVDNITDDFTGISNDSGTTHSYGGAIKNDGTINSITNSNFSDNTAIAHESETASGLSFGGAIYNDGIINNILNTTFSGNYLKSTGAVEGRGGAIANYGTINNINADFTGNQITGKDGYGAAIFNEGNNNVVIHSIRGNFSNNTINVTNAAQGGAIFATKNIGSINGTFERNSVTGANASGGAIYNRFSTINRISGSFLNNSAGQSGGAIANLGTIGTIENTIFTGNTAAQGGAIFNSGTITEINNAVFKNNDLTNSTGGFIYN